MSMSNYELHKCMMNEQYIPVFHQACLINKPWGSVTGISLLGKSRSIIEHSESQSRFVCVECGVWNVDLRPPPLN
jgi:hypothetical protein